MALSLGISPCPNDTYIFASLVEGRLACPENLGTLTTRFADVEELNTLARRGVLDVTKLSAAAVADVLDEYVILESGGALGRGCGPLLVAPEPVRAHDVRDAPIAVPGRLTTANLLLELHGGFTGRREELVFDAIMPALVEKRFAAGVIIHESRFTYEKHGLHLVLDLGEWWEKATGAPIPLGVIVARRSLGEETCRRIAALIRASLEASNANPASAKPFIRAHAQEMDEDVCTRHINTFVNEFSLSLGDAGRHAVHELVAKAAEQRSIVLPDMPFFVS